MDECSPQTTANTQRLWSFTKPIKKKNTTKMRANTFGFYALNGESQIAFKENSKKESVCSFLEQIRESNPEGEIIIILDNFRSHRANKTREKAEKLGIYLVFLPPYSPDLNPIEYIWKSIKREISVVFIENVEHLKTRVKGLFTSFSKRWSFAQGWISKFSPPITN